MTWQTTLQKKGNLNADASAVGRSYALLKRKAQNPLTLSPLGMALAACGGGESNTSSDSGELSITVVDGSKREYVGSSELDKFIISPSQLAESLPPVLFQGYEDVVIMLCQPAEGVPCYPRYDVDPQYQNFEISFDNETGTISNGYIFTNSADALAGLDEEERVAKAAEIAACETAQIHFYADNFNPDNQCGIPVDRSMSFEGYDILQITSQNDGNSFLGWIKVNGPNFSVTQIGSDFDLSYLPDTKTLYIEDSRGSFNVTDELDHVFIAGSVNGSIAFGEGKHTLLFESAKSFTESANLDITGLGSDDTIMFADNLLIFGNTEAKILSTDLSYAVGTVALASGFVAFTTDTTKMYFDADGDFSEGAIEFIDFADGLPSVEVFSTAKLVELARDRSTDKILSYPETDPNVDPEVVEYLTDLREGYDKDYVDAYANFLREVYYLLYDRGPDDMIPYDPYYWPELYSYMADMSAVSATLVTKQDIFLTEAADYEVALETHQRMTGELSEWTEPDLPAAPSFPEHLPWLPDISQYPSQPPIPVLPEMPLGIDDQILNYIINPTLNFESNNPPIGDWAAFWVAYEAQRYNYQAEYDATIATTYSIYLQHLEGAESAYDVLLAAHAQYAATEAPTVVQVDELTTKITYGDDDEFDLTDVVENTTVSDGLELYLDASDAAPLMSLDVTTLNETRAASFDLSAIEGEITSAILSMRAKPLDNTESQGDDIIVLSGFDTSGSALMPSYNIALGTDAGSNSVFDFNWKVEESSSHPEEGYELSIDLSNFDAEEGTGLSLIDHINTYDLLDVIITDDTMVDYISLEIGIA